MRSHSLASALLQELEASGVDLPQPLVQAQPTSAAAAMCIPRTSWQSYAVQSSCDSSDCSYCQGLARLRQAAGSKAGCWLRRKRSRTDLAAMDAGGEAQPAAEPSAAEQQGSGSGSGSNKQARVMSMWDHALAEPKLLHTVLGGEQESADASSTSSSDTTPGSSSDDEQAGYRAWSWDGAWADWHSAPPCRLRQVAAFQRPEPMERRRQTADIVCAVEFEEHGWLVATAGVAKQVRVYSLSSYLENPSEPRWQQPIRVHRMPSKLSSLAWNPDQPGVVTVGDYDGEVTQIDLESGHMVAEADGHAGRRVWSVSHSLLRPHLAASASDDGTVKLWAGPCLGQAVGVVRPPSGAPICGVQLSPFDEHTMALASSDHNLYVYDLRQTQQPLWTLRGHARAASYARFLSRGRLVSAAVDASLAVWDLPGLRQEQAQQAQQQLFGSSSLWDGQAGSCSGAAAAAAAEEAGIVQPWRRFQGHRNSKNFVGLAVRPEGQLVACGSEDAMAYSYQVSWDEPLAACSLGAAGGAGPAQLPGQEEGPFCSAVAWQPAVAGGPDGLPLLAAAMSDGELRVLGLQAPL